MVISRRTFLRFASGAGFVGTAALISACTPGSQPAATPPPGAAPTVAPLPSTSGPTTAPALAPPAAASQTRGGAGQLPTYIPQTGIKPDLPASPDGLVDP